MVGVGYLSTIAIDCPDPRHLAAFYSAVTGYRIDPDEDEDWVQLQSDDGPVLAFIRGPGYVAPHWPGSENSQQMHLDFDVLDLDIAEFQVLALGARKAEYQPGSTFRVFLDPAGHPFCLVLHASMR